MPQDQKDPQEMSNDEIRARVRRCLVLAIRRGEHGTVDHEAVAGYSAALASLGGLEAGPSENAASGVSMRSACLAVEAVIDTWTESSREFRQWWLARGGSGGAYFHGTAAVVRDALAAEVGPVEDAGDMRDELADAQADQLDGDWRGLIAQRNRLSDELRTATDEVARLVSDGVSNYRTASGAIESLRADLAKVTDEREDLANRLAAEAKNCAAFRATIDGLNADVALEEAAREDQAHHVAAEFGAGQLRWPRLPCDDALGHDAVLSRTSPSGAECRYCGVWADRVDDRPGAPTEWHTSRTVPDTETLLRERDLARRAQSIAITERNAARDACEVLGQEVQGLTDDLAKVGSAAADAVCDLDALRRSVADTKWGAPTVPDSEGWWWFKRVDPAAMPGDEAWCWEPVYVTDPTGGGLQFDVHTKMVADFEHTWGGPCVQCVRRPTRG